MTKSLPVLLLIASLHVHHSSLAGEPELGQQLHDKHCMNCHQAAIYTRENRIVHSFKELSERVRQCELSNELTWFDEEIDAVVEYLNSTYYRFEK